MRVRLPLFFLALSGMVYQGMAQWIEPSSGVVFDPPSRSIRRISGFLGAAQLSPPLVNNLDWAAVAPNGQRALAATTAGDLVWLDSLGAPDLSSIPLSPPGSGPYMGRWNPTSTAIRLHSAGCACFFTVALQSGQPALSGDPAPFDSTFGSVRDYFWRQSLTVVTTDTGLYEMRGAGTPRMAAAGSGLAFLLEESGKAWAVRGSTGEIMEIAFRYGHEARMTTVAADPVRLTDVAAIVSVPGSTFVLDRKTQSAYQIGIDTGVIGGAWQLEAPPGRLISLGGRPIWLIRERGKLSEPTYILDCSQNPQVVFVPGEGALQ